MTDTARGSRRLDDRYTVREGGIYLSGLQALVRLPLDVRRRDESDGLDTHVFVSGYEGSPLGGYDLELIRHRALLDAHRTRLQQGLNEELAANAVQGTQLALGRATARVAGVTGIWYGKAPGLDRATDAIRHANLVGTHPSGGVVALVGDDATAKSSTVPSSSELALAELSIPTLVPADAQDVLDLGLHAVMLSRISGLWAAMKIATSVADGACTSQVSNNRVTPVVPDVTFDGVAYRHTPTAHLVQPVLGQLEHSLHHRRLVLARRYARANGLNRVVAPAPDARIGVVAAGATFLDVCHALSRLGLDPRTTPNVRVLRLGMVWPLDPETIREFARGLQEIVVVEEKRSFIELAIKDVLYGLPDRPLVTGKAAPDGTLLLRPEADLDPDHIAGVLAVRCAAHGVDFDQGLTDGLVVLRNEPTLLPLAIRTPFFCSGCPHNRSTQVPSGSLVGAGIGCHGMAALLPKDRAGDVIGLTQMGGEGAPWIGMAGYVADEHLFQNLGDGTFHHSGSLAVRAAVAAGVNITFKLLYNGAVAMTGGQDAVGQLAVPDLCRVLLAEGVRRVVVTTDDRRRYRKVALPAGVTVHDRDDLLDLQESLRTTPGVTVLIHDQECATELRRKRKRGLAQAPAVRAFINERVCEGCGDCGAKSNCLSVHPVETDYGRKTRIHQPSCNQDLSCLDGDCPSFLTVVPGIKARALRAPDPVELADLPQPPEAKPDVAIRITGIGGTGVVTVAHVLATAAGLDGLSVRALDQTGLAQKGGAVVSDLRLSRAPSLGPAKLAAGECDLYLGCDSIVASSPLNLAACAPDRSRAVVSTALVPTGSMVIDATVMPPAHPDVVRQISARTEVERSVFVDAHAVTRELFDDDQFANIFLLGVAYQAGMLPITSRSLEQAIALNGVRVDTNVQAFRRGRLHVAAPAGQDAPPPATTASEDLVMRRHADLVAYQDRRYADRYADRVARVRDAESRVLPGEGSLTAAAARCLYKLMAYKDEYEVARLSTEPALLASLRDSFGDDARFAYRLHPPVLRALGMRRKLSIGPWFRHVFALLYACRRLRGTRFDPFGRSKVRRTERALVAEYEGLLEELIDGLTRGNHKIAVDLASAPDLVRGYEEIKLASVERYRTRVQELRDELELVRL